MKGNFVKVFLIMFNYSDTFYIVYYIMINNKLSERVISKKNTKYLLENTKHYPCRLKQHQEDV